MNFLTNRYQINNNNKNLNQILIYLNEILKYNFLEEIKNKFIIISNNINNNNFNKNINLIYKLIFNLINIEFNNDELLNEILKFLIFLFKNFFFNIIYQYELNLYNFYINKLKFFKIQIFNENLLLSFSYLNSLSKSFNKYFNINNLIILLNLILILKNNELSFLLCIIGSIIYYSNNFDEEFINFFNININLIFLNNNLYSIEEFLIINFNLIIKNNSNLLNLLNIYPYLNSLLIINNFKSQYFTLLIINKYFKNLLLFDEIDIPQLIFLLKSNFNEIIYLSLKNLILFLKNNLNSLEPLINLGLFNNLNLIFENFNFKNIKKSFNLLFLILNSNNYLLLNFFINDNFFKLLISYFFVEDNKLIIFLLNLFQFFLINYKINLNFINNLLLKKFDSFISNDNLEISDLALKILYLVKDLI